MDTLWLKMPCVCLSISVSCRLGLREPPQGAEGGACRSGLLCAFEGLHLLAAKSRPWQQGEEAWGACIGGPTGRPQAAASGATPAATAIG